MSWIISGLERDLAGTEKAASQAIGTVYSDIGSVGSDLSKFASTSEKAVAAIPSVVGSDISGAFSTVGKTIGSIGGTINSDISNLGSTVNNDITGFFGGIEKTFWLFIGLVAAVVIGVVFFSYKRDTSRYGSRVEIQRSKGRERSVKHASEAAGKVAPTLGALAL